MADTLSREDEFLLKEYDSAVHLTFHVDELRSRFTNLFITIAGAAAAAISLMLQGNAANSTLGKFEVVVDIFLILLTLVGILVVAVVAKLRKVQLEHFRITNNIRRHFLGTNYALWNVVELSDRTLPSPNLRSGTYYWSMMLMLLNSYIVALAVYLFLAQIGQVINPERSLSYAIVAALVFIVLQNILYFRLATPPPPRKYSEDVLPSQNLAKPRARKTQPK